MTKKILTCAAALAVLASPVYAQATYNTRTPNDPSLTANQVAPEPGSSHAARGTSARDGCFNVPNEPHNSADCDRIAPNDTNTAMNNDSTDLSGRPTGASANAARNDRINSGNSGN